MNPLAALDVAIAREGAGLDMPQYSHRNGETELPKPSSVLPEWFWFDGDVGGEFVTDGPEPTLVWDGTVEFNGDDHGYPIVRCVGRWWGPIPIPQQGETP